MITTPEQMREAAIAAVETELAKAKALFAHLEHYDLYFDGLQDALIRIRAIPIAPQPVAVTVKPLVDYILQDDLHNRLIPRIVDIAYLAWSKGRSGKNNDDGGPCDWVNDTKPLVDRNINKIRAALTIHPADPLSDPRVKALVEALNGCIVAIEHANMADGVCCCGDNMEGHSEPMNCGHSPVDMGEYHAHRVLTAARAALRAIGGEA